MEWSARFGALSDSLTVFFESDPRARNSMGQFSDSAAVTGISPSTTEAAYGNAMLPRRKGKMTKTKKSGLDRALIREQLLIGNNFADDRSSAKRGA